MTVPLRLDAHQHFWRYVPADYPWIAEHMDVLRRDWLPGDLRPLLDERRIDACLAVQARAETIETQFLLELADHNHWIAAVIGWADLRADDVERQLDRWEGRAKLAGLRHLLQDEPDVPAYVADAAFNRGIDALQKRGWVYEVLVRAPQLGAVRVFCARHDRGTLVLDHLGKPAIGGGADAEWRASLSEIAALPHVACKLSGLVTEVGDGPVVETELCRYLDTALDLFGPRRLMFGSDWPVCLLKAKYGEVVGIIERWSERLSAAEQEQIWGGTAVRCYGLTIGAN